MQTQTATRQGNRQGHKPRPRLTEAERAARYNESLTKAATGASLTNYPAIFEGFLAKGIAEDDIKPRENIFTFNAWKALGRSVKKGEHGVRVMTYATREAPASDDTESNEGDAPRAFKMPTHTTVFHISQTEPTKPRN